MESKSYKRVVTWVFLSFLFLFFIWGSVKKPIGYSDQENRYLQKKPEFSLESLWDGTYTKTYDTFLSDQFPLRNSWIGMRTLAERIRFQQDVNGVYFADNDYLIERFDKGDIETPQLKQNMQYLARFISSAKEQMGVDHVRVMLVPSASEILYEKLPFLASPYEQSQVLDQLELLVGEEVIVPVIEELKHYKNQPLYYKTDHHWTGKGAYYGYQAWAESMGVTPIVESEFQIEVASDDFLGSIQSKINLPWYADTIHLYHLKGNETAVYFDGNKEASYGMYAYDALETKDQYRVYLDGNHGLTEMVNPNVSEEGKGKKLLIIKDSFANSFAPFSASHYETVMMLDLRYANVHPAKLIKEQGVDDVLVLYQIPGFAKERNLVKLLPFE